VIRTLILRLPSPLQPLADERFAAAGVEVVLKRDDLIHPDLPGNKWRKLKYNLAAATEQGHRTLLTFGGAYSNHVRATAAAGEHFGFATIGVIRGEEHLPLNPSLEYAVGRGMSLTYLDRTAYRSKREPHVIEALRERYGDFHLIPEGGSNAAAVRGCAELPGEIEDRFDVICCAVGTGGTLAGIAAGLRPGQRAVGFAALKGGFLAAEVTDLQRLTYGTVSDNWHIEDDFHHGGYARTTPELDGFAADFEHRHRLTLERIYVAKMMFGLTALISQGKFAQGTRVVAVVTG
jgi:1-aminocyclopropane-1-carboxylate deaminase